MDVEQAPPLWDDELVLDNGTGANEMYLSEVDGAAVGRDVNAAGGKVVVAAVVEDVNEHKNGEERDDESQYDEVQYDA